MGVRATSHTQQITASFDYEAYVRTSEEIGSASDETAKDETAMRSPEDVHAHFNELMHETLQDV